MRIVANSWADSDLFASLFSESSDNDDDKDNDDDDDKQQQRHGPLWLKISHSATKQAILFNTQIKGCKAKDNVTAFMNMSIVLRVVSDDPSETPGDHPSNVFKFVHEVTPV